MGRPPSEHKLAQVAFKLPKELLYKVDLYAQQQERTRSFIFVKALTEFLAKRKVR